MSGRPKALLAIAGVATLAVCGSSAGSVLNAAPGALPAAAQCKPALGHMIASNGRVNVYGLHGAVYACEVGSGKRTRLGNSTICIRAARVDRVAVAADLVAYGVERCGIDTGFASVIVLKLSTLKQLHSYPALIGGVGPESYQAVGSLAVRRDGDVAWIASVTSIVGHGTRVEVDREGSLLDSGAGIDPGSLRLKGSKLSWRHGKNIQTATLS